MLQIRHSSSGVLCRSTVYWILSLLRVLFVDGGVRSPFDELEFLQFGS